MDEFAIVGTIEERPQLAVLRARRRSDGATIVLKVLGAAASARDEQRLRHEQELGHALDAPGIVHVDGLTTWQGRPALVLEAFGDASLEQVIAAGPVPLGDALEVGAQLARALGDLHARGIVHRDVKPQNVLVDRATRRVKLADLALASLVASEPSSPSARPPALIEGSLPYMSPEQTGRMNRVVDPRSDLYSLGVTLFQLLTGRLPFEATDALGWIHCHLARPAPAPSALVASLPPVVSDLVSKLLAKQAEERYQSARGLARDLERCAAEWQRAGSIARFVLAQDDLSERLQIAQWLYGRAEESAVLRRAFERVRQGGAPELVLVSGYAGVGKSSLVRELHKPVVASRGFFLSGKFDQLGEATPYATIVQAFRGLVEEILAGSEAEVQAWRARLGAALHPHERLIIDLVPPLELVLGPRPPVPALSPVEAQARLYAVFGAFLSVVARDEHPVALFLDDLQWADPASLDLLVHTLAQPETRNLLVIGAYRDNEVSPGHPLMLALDRARAAAVTVSTLEVPPLSREHLAAWLADTLHTTPAAAAPLVALVHEKTAGNPFFTTQFLTTLAEAQLLRLNPGAGAWRWDMDRIRAQSFTDNVVDLLVDKLTRLPEATQALLRLAACVGGAAETSILATVSEGSEEGIHRALWDAVREGLLLRQEEGYRFLHDRIQQAAYSLIPEDRRSALHLRVGRLLLASTPREALPARVFAIVGQFNRALALVTDEVERDRIAELNLAAGGRAQVSAAYPAAAGFLASAMELLGAGAWQRNRPLAWTVHFERARCEYGAGNLDGTEALLAGVLERSTSRQELTSVYRLWIAVHTTRGQYADAVEKGRRCLALFGVDIPAQPSAADVEQAYAAVWGALGGRPIERLAELPLMTDPEALAKGEILYIAAVASFYVSRDLCFVLQCQLTTLGLRHGHSGPSCVGYTGLSMSLGPVFERHEDGLRFARLAAALIERHGFVGHKPVAFCAIGAAAIPWIRPVAEGVAYLEEALQSALVHWQMNAACWACIHLLSLRLFQGAPLDELERLTERYIDVARRARFGDVIELLEHVREALRELRGASVGPGDPEPRRFANSVTAGRYFVLRLQVDFLFGRHEAALAAAERAREVRWAMSGMSTLAESHTYHALALAAVWDAAPAERQSEIREALRAYQATLARWAGACPSTFSHKHALVSAEAARLAGAFEAAVRLYQRAIAGAREAGFLQDEALAYELGARFYRGQDLPEVAEAYLREARARYERWGAGGKVRALDRLHPGLAHRPPVAPSHSLAVRAAELDLLSVVKACQSISQEMVLPRLHETLMRIVLEQAGAQRGWLVQPRGGEPGVMLAVRDGGGSGAGRPVDPETLPQSILQYVARTRTPVVLDDATRAPRFGGDPCLARRRPRSVLCLPIVRQTELCALLYLENDLATGAFTPDKLALLELLAAQAAIALENARLLEEERAARAAAEQAKARAALLAEATGLCVQAGDAAVLLPRLARAVVPTLGQWCLIHLLREGEPHLVAATHVSPAREALLREREERAPIRWASGHPVVRVIATREPLLIEPAVDEPAGDLSALGAPRLVAPLVVRGRALGAISLGGAPAGAAELEALAEIARRAALALDNAQKSEFFAVASHELNNPMGALKMTLEWLASPEGPRDPEGVRRGTESALRQGRRLGRLIGNLLDVTRLERGALALRREPVNLGELVREVVARYGPELTVARCAVTVVAPASLVGEWDPSRIDQVVLNLLTNAAKFGAGKPIEVRVAGDGGRARVSVTDQGIGIPPAEQPRIFERYERGAGGRGYSGLGLGLYICRRIVEAHGGEIRVESEPGRGSTFTLELPCGRP